MDLQNQFDKSVSEIRDYMAHMKEIHKRIDKYINSMVGTPEHDELMSAYNDSRVYGGALDSFCIALGRWVVMYSGYVSFSDFERVPDDMDVPFT